MTKVNLLYLSIERDGVYVRRFGKRIRIREALGTTSFLIAYNRAVDALSAGRVSRVLAPLQTHPAGSLGWLASRYFGSIEFLKLDATSQRTRRGVIESCLREPFTTKSGDRPMGDCPIGDITTKKVRQLRDAKAGTPGAANNRHKYLSAMFSWAIEADHMDHNPARDVRKISTASGGFHSWTVEEVEQYRARHPIGTKARLALELLLLTGVRRGDLVTLGRQHVRNGVLRFVPRKMRYKRQQISEKPILPQLQAVIDQSPTGDLTYLITEYGKPFTAAGFGGKFRAWCNEAGLKHCTAHGLRKAGATLAAENGATIHELMALFDWSTPGQAKVYTDAADRKKLTAKAMPLLERKT